LEGAPGPGLRCKGLFDARPNFPRSPFLRRSFGEGYGGLFEFADQGAQLGGLFQASFKKTALAGGKFVQ
jgi:hypothetical protein